ncbi:ABC-type transport auxiliary lipoprotein family protein [Flexibacterium corallicola]|uniref:ABC-type transport auxiliary lipoprotein family protein n=1 Tax=Flexibacterium corallicola TaxID=3037259 RepID=UPI00286F7CFD|nr:ABC-type transport auxiliary lipoprotein family protein [Pseudovibrio sp. M1P-2-3]
MLQKLKIHGALVLLALGVGSCGASAPTAFYDLSAPSSLAVSSPAKNVQLLVPQPKAIQALAGSSIAVAELGRIYSYYPKVSWTDTLPNVFQAKLIETLENSGKFRAVSQPGQGLLIDYQLQTTIRAFELYIDGQTRAHIEIAARLVDDRDGRSVKSHLFTSDIPTKNTNVDEAVDAMTVAADAVMREITAWVLQTL